MDSSLPASIFERLTTGAIASLYAVFDGKLSLTMMVHSHAVASSGTAASRARRLLRLFRVGLTCCPSHDGSLAVAENILIRRPCLYVAVAEARCGSNSVRALSIAQMMRACFAASATKAAATPLVAASRITHAARGSLLFLAR